MIFFQRKRLEFSVLFLFKHLGTDDTYQICSTKNDKSRLTRMDNGEPVDRFLSQSSNMS